jgi:molecular chaperone GrpE
MEDNNTNQQKPLRRTSNKIKDIYDAYVKNDKTKNIPISDSDTNLNKSEQVDSNSNTVSSDEANQDAIHEQVFLEMQSRIEKLDTSLTESNNQIEALRKESAELKELSLRKTAELENFRKRSMKEKSDIIEYANERLLSNFVEILDDFNMALSSTTNTTDIDSIKRGLEMIMSKAKKLFDDAGVKEMEFDSDTEFDVHLHEAMMMAPSDKPEGTVLQVLQKGYLLKDKVLRHAKVITSSGNMN